MASDSSSETQDPLSYSAAAYGRDAEPFTPDLFSAQAYADAFGHDGTYGAPARTHGERVPTVRVVQTLPIAVRCIEGMGRGVFATRLIHAGEDFGTFPLLALPDGDPALNGLINDYVFGRDEGPSYLVLGWPSLLNHVARVPNMDREWVETPEGWALRFFAVRDIASGEQMLIDYGCEQWWT